MRGVVRGAVTVLLIAVVLQQIGVPEWFESYDLNLVYLGFGLLTFAYWGFRREFDDVGVFVAHGVVATALIGVMLTLIATREMFLLDDHAIKAVGICLLFLAYPLVQHDPVAFLRDAGVYYVAFATLTGIYFFHVVIEGGAYPIVMGLVVGANLFVVPRYVDRASFLAALSWVAGAVSALGMAAYAVGEYSVFSIEVRFWTGSFTPLFAESAVPVLRATFLNPNTTGILAFAGVIASLVRFVEASERESPWAVFPAALLVLNGVALYFTQSRGSMLAAAVGCALYLSYVVGGRRAVPYAFTGVVGVVCALLVGIHTGALAFSSGGRFALWWGGIQAIAANPSLLGAGLVDSGAFIDPYVGSPYNGASPHNSYLMIAIRTGLLGGVAYLVLTAGSVLAGAFDADRVDPAALSLAVAFGLNQMFEIYSLYQTLMPSVLAALAFGYLIVDDSSLADRSEPAPTEAEAEADADDVYARVDGSRV